MSSVTQRTSQNKVKGKKRDMCQEGKSHTGFFSAIFVEGSTQGNYNLKSILKHMKVFMTTGDLPGQLSYGHVCDKCA